MICALLFNTINKLQRNKIEQENTLVSFYL